MSLCQHLLAIPTFWWVFEVSCKSDSYQMEKMSVVGKAKRVESPSHCFVNVNVWLAHIIGSLMKEVQV